MLVVAALIKMERTLHLGQGENINDFSDNAKDDVMESDAAGSNTTSTIVLNTTQLDSMKIYRLNDY